MSNTALGTPSNIEREVAPRLTTIVIQEGEKTTEVVTEFESIAAQPWDTLTELQQREVKLLLAAIHTADVEVARAPVLVRTQFWLTSPIEVPPLRYAQTVRKYLEAARQEVSLLRDRS